MSDHNAQLAYPWNAPLPVIDPETFGRAQPTALRQAIQSYINEDIRIDARLDEETVAFLTTTDEGKRINSHLHHNEERRIRLENWRGTNARIRPRWYRKPWQNFAPCPRFLATRSFVIWRV